MNILETVFHFLAQIARIIYPRKQKSTAGSCPYPCPTPTFALFLMAITLLPLLTRQTEVTLTAIRTILSLCNRVAREVKNKACYFLHPAEITDFISL